MYPDKLNNNRLTNKPVSYPNPACTNFQRPNLVLYFKLPVMVQTASGSSSRTWKHYKFNVDKMSLSRQELQLPPPPPLVFSMFNCFNRIPRFGLWIVIYAWGGPHLAPLFVLFCARPQWLLTPYTMRISSFLLGLFFSKSVFCFWSFSLSSRFFDNEDETWIYYDTSRFTTRTLMTNIPPTKI